MHVNPNEHDKIQEKIAQLSTLDPKKVATFLGVYQSANRIYVTSKPYAHGSHDLYYLKHIRTSFSVLEIAEVAF